MATTSKTLIKKAIAVDKSESVQIIETDSGIWAGIDAAEGVEGLTIPSGKTLPSTDPRLVAFAKIVGFPDLKVPKKVNKKTINGVWIPVSKFIEVGATIAMARIGWLAEDKDTRKSFEEYIADVDYSDLLKVK